MQDLNWVREVCALLLRQIADARANITQLEALQSAAIIRYGRCYSGVRTAFVLDQSFLDQLPERLRQVHERAKALRDKHYAHSVNDWELNIPVAQIKKSGEDRSLIGVSVQSHRMIGLDQRDIEALQELAGALEALVNDEFRSERERVMESIKGIPIDELERRLSEPMPLPGVGPVDRARGR